MIENKEHTILILQLINSNGNTNFLEKLGYSFDEIAKFISNLRKEKFVDFNKESLQLTTLGKQHLYKLNKDLNRKGLSMFISPLMQYRIKKSDKFDVYLPILKNKG